MLDLTASDIHLWLAFYDEFSDGRLHKEYFSLLDEAEREQQPRFYFARDRLRYLITRALVRTVLSRYLPVSPRAWQFATNEYGRPRIANAELDTGRLCFNVSHTHALIVIGVTRGREIGVDVENVRDRAASIEIADRFFAPEEVAALAQTPREHQQDRFFEYWTFKESYIKARGMGLSIPLDKFSFRFPKDHAVELSIDPEIEDDPRRWQFWQFRPRPEYLVALCVERLSTRLPTLCVRAITPAGAEQVLDPLWLLRSAERL